MELDTCDAVWGLGVSDHTALQSSVRDAQPLYEGQARRRSDEALQRVLQREPPLWLSILTQRVIAET